MRGGGTLPASARIQDQPRRRQSAIDAERVRRGLPSLAEARRSPRFLARAARYGLGVGDPRLIQEVRGFAKALIDLSGLDEASK